MNEIDNNKNGKVKAAQILPAEEHSRETVGIMFSNLSKEDGLRPEKYEHYREVCTGMETNYHSYLLKIGSENRGEGFEDRYQELIHKSEEANKEIRHSVRDLFAEFACRRKQIKNEADALANEIKRVAREVTGKDSAELREEKSYAKPLILFVTIIMIALAFWLETTMGKFAIAMGTTGEIGVAMAVTTALLLIVNTTAGSWSMREIINYRAAAKLSPDARMPNKLTWVIAYITHISMIVFLFGITLLRGYVIVHQNKSWSHMTPVLMLIVAAVIFYVIELYIFVRLGGHPAEDVKKWLLAKTEYDKLKLEHVQLKNILTHPKMIAVLNDYKVKRSGFIREQNEIIRSVDRANALPGQISHEMERADLFFQELIKRIAKIFKIDEEQALEKFNLLRPLRIDLPRRNFHLIGSLEKEIDPSEFEDDWKKIIDRIEEEKRQEEEKAEALRMEAEERLRDLRLRETVERGATA